MIKRAKTEGAKALADLAIQMWTDHVPEELSEEFRQLSMKDDAAALSSISMISRSPSPSASCAATMSKERRARPSDILKAFLSRKAIGNKALPQSCCQNARNGQKKRAAANLPAIAGLTILIVSGFTWHWDLRKPIGSFVLDKICRFVV